MNREELLVYIRNAVLIGDMVNNCQDFDVITNLECRIKEYVDLVELKESINGSIEYNGMYFKEEMGRLYSHYVSAITRSLTSETL